jgi:phosphoribosylformylglycinamidine (FGAM) synthase-like amidotransferase family enzyme
MTSIRIVLKEIQDDTAIAVRYADQSAEYTDNPNGDMGNLLLLVDRQVVQLQSMLAKAKLVQEKVASVQSHLRSRQRLRNAS